MHLRIFQLQERNLRSKRFRVGKLKKKTKKILIVVCTTITFYRLEKLLK